MPKMTPPNVCRFNGRRIDPDDEVEAKRWVDARAIDVAGLKAEGWQLAPGEHDPTEDDDAPAPAALVPDYAPDEEE